jgi:hypothetical protein
MAQLSRALHHAYICMSTQHSVYFEMYTSGRYQQQQADTDPFLGHNYISRHSFGRRIERLHEGDIVYNVTNSGCFLYFIHDVFEASVNRCRVGID